MYGAYLHNVFIKINYNLNLKPSKGIQKETWLIKWIAIYTFIINWIQVITYIDNDKIIIQDDLKQSIQTLKGK